MKSSKKELPIKYQTQQRPMWCWCAAGTCCALYYDENSGWTQCKLAQDTIVPRPDDCCKNTKSSSCNQFWALDNPAHDGSFDTTGIANGFEAGAITFERLKNEIDAGKLVAYRLKLDNGTMFHFVVINGYEDSDSGQLVNVQDSFFGESHMPYQEFTTNYRGETSSVTHSFFTKPKKLT